MRSANIKKASQDEQQNQATTTNNNYIQNLKCPFQIIKFNNQVRIASDETETNKNNLFFTRKDMGRVHKKAR